MSLNLTYFSLPFFLRGSRARGYTALVLFTVWAIHESPVQVSPTRGPIVIGPYGTATRPARPAVGAIHESPVQVSPTHGPIVIGPYGTATRPARSAVGDGLARPVVAQTTSSIYKEGAPTSPQKKLNKSLIFRKKILAFPGWIEYTSAVRVWTRGELWPRRGSRQEVAGCHPGNFCRANASKTREAGAKIAGRVVS